MKGYELLKEMPNMKIGTKIRRIEDGQVYKLEKAECTRERKFSRIGNKKGIERFITYKNMHRDFEVIEENKEIEELDEMQIINARPEINAKKINEIVRAVNKINKELEEQQTEDINIVERELNKMF